MLKDSHEIFLYYKRMETLNPDSHMIQEIRGQYQEMAAGGDGGPMGYRPHDYNKECGDDGPSCREYNYQGYPDSFFQEVCALMNWAW